MKILMWHCIKYNAKLTGISNRPVNIQPEKRRMDVEKKQNCIVAMITVEEKDEIEKAIKASDEIKKFAQDMQTQNIVIMPFVHLSNQIADSKTTITTINSIENKLEKEFTILKSHFGHHKEVFLHTFGHKLNVRHREI